VFHLYVILLFTAVLLSLLWRYAVRERLIRTDLADEAVKLITRRRYLIIAVYNLIPIRDLRRRRPAT
jgi:hypothetical protein